VCTALPIGQDHKAGPFAEQGYASTRSGVVRGLPMWQTLLLRNKSQPVPRSIGSSSRRSKTADADQEGPGASQFQDSTQTGPLSRESLASPRCLYVTAAHGSPRRPGIYLEKTIPCTSAAPFQPWGHARALVSNPGLPEPSWNARSRATLPSAGSKVSI
jgi:hypothetical protein